MRYLDDADLKLDVDMYVCTYIRGLMLISKWLDNSFKTNS